MQIVLIRRFSTVSFSILLAFCWVSAGHTTTIQIRMRSKWERERYVWLYVCGCMSRHIHLKFLMCNAYIIHHAFNNIIVLWIQSHEVPNSQMSDSNTTISIYKYEKLARRSEFWFSLIVQINRQKWNGKNRNQYENESNFKLINWIIDMLYILYHDMLILVKMSIEKCGIYKELTK